MYVRASAEKRNCLLIPVSSSYLITGLNPNKIGLTDAVGRKSCCRLSKQE